MIRLGCYYRCREGRKMTLIAAAAALAALGILANRFGADSRETARSGWRVERRGECPPAAAAETASADLAAPAPVLSGTVARRALHRLAS
jgi:hypothetical protein